jgi:hypothetical protein
MSVRLGSEVPVARQVDAEEASGRTAAGLRAAVLVAGRRRERCLGRRRITQTAARSSPSHVTLTVLRQLSFVTRRGWSRRGTAIGSGGDEVKTVGEGFLVKFDLPAGAIRWAQAIRAALADLHPEGHAAPRPIDVPA